jgi:geranylgeranyl diphosphate synthase type II
VLKGGKRIRPAVTLAVVEMLGGDPEQALGPAAILELIHAASLILDDLPCMDDASRRRGLPTVHLVFGEDQAVLAGVALLNLSYQFMAGWEKEGLPGIGESLGELALAVGTEGTIGGQSADLATHPDNATFERLEYIHSHKTGALFIAGARMGARLANANVEAVKDIERYAKNLGLAYQIMDDILDVVSTPDITGKTLGRDENKVTFVRFIGLDAARKLISELTDFAISSLARFGTKAGLLTELAKMLSHRDR